MARHAAPGGGPGDALNSAAEVTLTLAPLNAPNGGRRVGGITLESYVSEGIIMLSILANRGEEG